MLLARAGLLPLDLLARAGSELVEALWPRRCRLCGGFAVDALACAAHELPSGPDGARCGRCAASLPSGVPDGARCGACRRDPPGWRRLIVLGDYRSQAVLRDWVLAFKHGGRPGLAEPLGAALGERALACGVAAASERGEPPPLLVGVPLHPLRRLERGYDQARLLARAVARATGLQERGALRRRRDTAVQGGPGAVSRAANVRDAFAPAARARPSVEGREVWLVDDVVTSGATLRECARALRRLGARRVSALALARAAPARGRLATEGEAAARGAGYPAPP